MALRRTLLLPGLAVGIGVLAMTATTLVASAEPSADQCATLTTDLFQLVNRTTEASFVTPYRSEAANAESAYGYSSLGVAGRVSTRPDAGLVAVYRLQKGADFLFAAQQDEVAQAKAEGYSGDAAPAFWAATEATDACADPVAQLTKGDRHRLAVGAASRTSLEAAGWRATRTSFAVARATGQPPGGTSGPTSPEAAGTDGRPVPSGPTAKQIKGSDKDTKFSIAVIPDTQQETWTDADTRLRSRSEWLASNRKKLDLRFVVHVGDVTDWDTPDHAQYARAANGLLPVQAKIPWAAAIGNHDTHAVCAGGSACPGRNTSVDVRDTSTFNRYFPRSRFGTLKGQFEQGKVDNAYFTFRSGGRDWLVLTLELWPRPEAVTWAQQVVSANPRRNVIVVTHSYLDADGSVSRSNGGYGATSPQYLFDHLVRRYPNVKLVLSGHVGSAAVRTDKGAKGNRVVSMLQCFHDRRSNPVRLVEVDTKKGTLSTRVYLPSRGTVEKKYSQKIKGLSFL